MQPTYSDNGLFVTFIAENESKPVFYAHSENPFDVLVTLPDEWSEEEVKGIISLLEKVHELGFKKGKSNSTENVE